jgi:NADH dehydrogenase [ubiquinone] 1 alpha subcomplex assembly factor 7
MIGLWLVWFWRQHWKPDSFHLVELGPGRGTLLKDVLRTLRRFSDVYATLKQIDLIEMSPTMRALQKDTLQCTSSECIKPTEVAVDQANTADGVPILWYTSIASLPKSKSA